MKRFLSLLLAVMMIVSCVPAMADEEWKINATTQLVSRKSAAEKLDDIVVPAEVDGVAVRGVEYMAFNMYKNFKSLTIADTAVMLDRGVLRDLPKLETVDLPENLLVIREGNFTNLPMLTSVVVPASVAVVHSSFSNCKSLTSITFEGMCPVFASAGTYDLFADLPADCVIYVPNNQVHVYKAAFADREDVAARIQPSGKNAIAVDRTVPETDFVFDAATGTITDYTGSASYLLIPAAIDGVQVKHIAADAFFQCHSLCCVVVPEGVETVGDWAFAGIALLSYVSLPSTLVSLGNEAFSSNKTYMSAIAYNGSAVPTFSADAFAGFKGDWHVILPYGSDQAYVDAFAAYIAPSADTAVVGASLIDPNAFPALDAEAAVAFTGTWNGVAVFDGTDTYGMDLLGLTVTVVLNDDGTGSLAMDSDVASGRWYVDGGAAVFAPIYEEGGKPALEEAIPMPLDENNRMVIDLGGLYLMMELEGATYATSAIPAAPANPTEGAEMLLGDWYDDVGNKLTLTEDGVMTFTWAFDGWVDEYTWAVVDGAAVVTSGSWNGLPITLENGILMITNGEGIFQIFSVDGDLSAYYGDDDDDEMPEATPIGSEGEAYFGTWTMDMGGMAMNLILNQDGTCAMEMFGEYEYAVWTVEDGVAMVMGDAMYIDANGCLVAGSMGMTFTKVSGAAAPAPAPATDADLSAYYGDWTLETFMGMPAAELDMAMTLTISEDGTCTLFDGYSAETAYWTVEDGMVAIDGEKLAIDASGKISMGDGMMVFVKGGAAAPAPTPAGIPHIEATADDYIGGWICVEMPSMQLLLLDGEANMIDGTELYTTTWEVVDGVAEFDGMKLYTQEDWSGILDMGDGTLLTFERGYVEKPKAPAPTAAPAPAEPEADVDVSAFIGEWTLETMMGMPAAELYMTMTLTINEDGSVSMYDGYSTEDGFWTIENGAFVIDGEALVVVDGKLSMSDGLMIFVPGGYVEPAPVPSAPEAPAAGGFSSYEDYMGIKFVATTFTSYGTTMDASALGAEYSVLFRADGTCDFTMGGLAMPNLPWGLQEVAMGLTKTDAFVINYYGVNYNCIPTETGFDMDFYGTMNLHFVPAQ